MQNLWSKLGLHLAFSQGILCHFLTIPTTPFTPSSGETYSLRNIKKIVVDTRYVRAVDETGQTLIPPSLLQFAETFQEDLETTLSIKIPLKTQTVKESSHDSIFLTLSSKPTFLDAAGRQSSEGYTIDVTGSGIVIAGASPLGVWWGTRSLLQAAKLHNLEITLGSGTDTPGWASRGVMLDAGRHYYPPKFVTELCAYMSYFKQNELHLHLSDNMFINYNEFDRDEALNLYSAFRLLSNSPALDGLARFSNESYTREAFDMIQQQCARRGVVIIPEIEAPAHALSIVRWKPQLGLDDPTMLNLTHHETMPTLKMIWKTFLPWFHSKTVHIGADEYSADHIPDYTRYVNEISRFIKQNSNKHARIWATFIPGKGGNTNKDVAIQHWAPYESNPLFDYINSGYQVLNSDFAIYVVPKWSPYFKQSLDLSLIFNGNPLGGAFSPNIFDRTNATRNPPRNHRAIIGHIAPLWNDWGRTASTYLEAYWSWRDGLPALADKQWGGNISIPEYDTSFAKLQPRVPGQNLDRRVESKSETIIKYDFRQSNNAVVKDLSGNKYVGKLYGCKVKDSVLYLSNGCYMETPISSKGRDYSLSFWVNPSYSKPAPLITGEDSALWAGYDHYTNITMVSASHPYSLNYTLPVGTWTHLALVGRGNSTVLEIYNKCQGQRETHTFTTRVDTGGVQASGGTRHVWLPIAFEAPVQRIGQGFEGMIKEFTLKELA